MLLLKDLMAMLLVGDGVLGAAWPTRHLRRWSGGPGALRQGIELAARHRAATRAAALVEVGAGLWFASRLPGRRSS